MAEELPVLIAAVADEKARELEEASRVGRNVWVKLKWEPTEPGPHLLEIYTPSTNIPLRLLAEPLGSSNESGVALRIYPWEEDEPEVVSVSFPEVTHDPFVGRSLAGGRFEILSAIGEGSIGAVYRARHTGLGIVVALKVLHEAFQRDAEFSRRFYAEALAMSQLDHTNLIHIYDFGQEPDGLLYIAMAFVDGSTLRVMQRSEKRFETVRISSIMLQVCAGLGHAHARGLLHRDVKPDNVMIVAKQDDDGNRVETVKVLDFGFAVPPNISGEVAQRLAGTPVYMSPEQCLGEPLDERSDVYSCGIMMYELATGTVPFLALDAKGIYEMHLHTPAPLVAEARPDVDPRFDRVVQKALSKSREDRHPNMQELRTELKALLAREGASARTTGSFDRRSMPSLPAAPAALAADIAESPTPASVSGTSSVMGASADEVADVLAKDTSAWLGELVRQRDVRAFAEKLTELDGAVRVLAARADGRTLQMLSAVVTKLDARLQDEDAKTALARVARLFKDPQVLGPIAMRLLTLENQEDGLVACARIIADAQVAGAYALYGARTKIAVDQRARIAFVTTMKSLGESALPVVRAALERVLDAASTGEHAGVAALAEDLLLSVPAALDEVTGHLVMKYAASRTPTLCRAAARALPRVWGERASPALLRLVDHEDDSVRIAAIVGLREVGAVDADAVRRIGALVDSGVVASAKLSTAITAALQAASPEASTDAASVLDRLAAGA